MNVGARELTIWSFMVSSAHGAGLMLLPFVLGAGGGDALAGAAHVHYWVPATSPGRLGGIGLFAALLHTASYLAVAGTIAWVVYRRLGLRFLRTAWVNVDVIWAGALIVTALVTPLS